jgi:hypothetical protein
MNRYLLNEVSDNGPIQLEINTLYQPKMCNE